MVICQSPVAVAVIIEQRHTVSFRPSESCNSLVPFRGGRGYLASLEMNPVEKRIRELASFELGQAKRIIHKARRQEIIPGKQYAWLLFEKEQDTKPVETVLLDVSLPEATAIDREVIAEIVPLNGVQQVRDRPRKATP